MVIWIIGQSGSGKTFFAKKLSRILNKKKIFLVDGDEVRKYLTHDLGYTKKDRYLNSIYIQNLCKYLENKGYFVICAIQSIFNKHQKENRKIFKNYFQIYLKTENRIIFNKNHKLSEFKKNIVGKDIKFPKPYKSNLTINNKFKDHKKILNKMYKLIINTK